jgi:hypothetical protein
MPGLWSHKVRIYRNVQTKKHDLSLSLSEVDIYGEDQWAAVLPVKGGLIDVDGSLSVGMALDSVEINLPRYVDVSEGYTIVVKKPRTLEGRIEAVTAKLTRAVSIGATSIYVDQTIRFEPGDQISILEGANSDLTKVQAVGRYDITLYADRPITHNFTQAATVHAVTFYKVISVRAAQGSAPFKSVIAQETVRTGPVA